MILASSRLIFMSHCSDVVLKAGPWHGLGLGLWTYGLDIGLESTGINLKLKQDNKLIIVIIIN